MQQKSELPEGWAISTLNEISDDIKYGYTASAEKNVVGPHLLRITDIQNGRVDWENVPFCKIKEDQISRYELKPNDIVFARTGATTGKSYLISSCPRSVFASYLIRLRPNENIDPKFLSLFFNTYDYWEQISQNISGIAQPNCNAAKLKELILPFPPLPEQHRIVSAIESLFARLDVTNEKIDRVLEILKKFRESVLAAACEGRLTEDWRKANPDVKVAKELVESIINEKKMQSGRRKASLNNDSDESIIQNIPESWFESNLDKISIKITDGTHHSPPNGPEGDFKYITAKNIKNDGIDLKNVTFVSSEIHDGICSRCNPEYGDLLLIKDGATTGIVTLNNLTEPFSMLSSVALLKFPEKISNKYIMYYMRSPDFQSNVLDKMGGAAITRLTLKKISNMIVALPPLPEQQEIVRRIDALFAFADSIETKVTAAREKTEKLRQSILAKAFSGELVETEAEIARKEGRDYESAEVLIERIKEERGRVEETMKLNLS